MGRGAGGPRGQQEPLGKRLLGTLLSLTTREFLPTFLPHPFSRPVSSHFTLWESRAGHRRAWFPLCLSALCTPEAGEGLSPGPSGARMYQTHMEAGQVWPWGKLPTLKEAPGPAESAPGITNRRPDTPWHFFPQTPNSQVSRRGYLIVRLRQPDRSVME